MCQHQPSCPPADACDHDAARLIAFHPEQGWGLLCNGVVVFDDTGELLPDGTTLPAQRSPRAREAAIGLRTAGTPDLSGTGP